MGKLKTDDDVPGAADPAGERELRGEALDGSEQERAADHAVYQKKRGPDDVVRVDEDKDTLYEDGLDMDDDTPPFGSDAHNWNNTR